MTDTTSKASGGVGFLGLLFITFLVLKLTHVIDWSWWWICAPLWGIPAIIILLIIGCAIAVWIENIKANRKYKNLNR